MLAVGDGGGADNAEQLVVELGLRIAAVTPPSGPTALQVDLETAPAGHDAEGGTFARRVGGLVGRGDVLVACSPSGVGADVLAAGRAALSRGALVLSFTGSLPNPLASCSTEAVTVAAGTPAAIRQRHQLALQLLCEAFEDALASRCRLEPTMSDNRLRRPSAVHEFGPW